MLAAPLVHALAAAPGLRAFIEHAHELRREYKVDSEDVALGYWLARLARLQSTPPQPLTEAQGPQQGPQQPQHSALPLAAPAEHVQYVQYVQTPPNSVFNVHCFQNTGMYQARK